LLFESFKRVADSKKTGVNDDDLIIIVDELLQTIIEHVDVVEGGGGRNMRYVLKQLQVFTGLNCTTPTATVTILDSHTPLSSSSSSEETGSEKNYKQITDCGVGSGGVEAIFNAINRVLDVGVGVGVETYRVESVGCGGDSLATATIRVNGNVKIENFKDVNVKIENAEPQNEIEMDIKKEIICNNGKITVVGVGSDEDVMVASAKAYLNAINKLMGNEHERNGNGCRNVEI
jgi:2-isopropylmalate synthase